MEPIMNKTSRLEAVLDNQIKAMEEVSLLVDEAIQAVTTDFKARYDLEVFQARQVKEYLARLPEWEELEVSLRTLFRTIRSLGWERGVLHFRGTRTRRIKVWAKKDRPAD